MLFREIKIKYAFHCTELRCIAYCFYFDKSPNLYTGNIPCIQIEIMRGTYTLEWLESLITVSLNPTITNVTTFLPEQITDLRSRIEKKKIEQQSLLNDQVFSLLEENRIKVLINQYHSTLIILLDQAFENNKNIPSNKPVLKQLTNEVMTCVEELLSFIEIRFPNYLRREETVPVTCLSKTKKELKQRTE
jgi:hypothetical protein